MTDDNQQGCDEEEPGRERKKKEEKAGKRIETVPSNK